MTVLKNLLLLIVFSMLVFSCNNNTKKTQPDEDAFDDINVNTDLPEALDFPKPSAVEVIDLLNKTGSGYIFEVTNPPENVENYISYRQKAINLGIYGADLTYCITYSKKNETAAYLDNFVLLIEDLEISNLDQNFFITLQNNLDNKDSLFIIVKNAIIETHNYLEKNDKGEIALYALVGSWVESLYLVGSTVKYSQNKLPLYRLLLERKKDLDRIVALMEQYKNEEEFADLYTSLNDINDLFVKIEGKVTDYKKTELLKDKIIAFRNTLI